GADRTRLVRLVPDVLGRPEELGMGVADIEPGEQARPELPQERALRERVVHSPEGAAGSSQGLRWPGSFAHGPAILRSAPRFAPHPVRPDFAWPHPAPAKSTTARAVAVAVRPDGRMSSPEISTLTVATASAPPSEHSQLTSRAPLSSAYRAATDAG